VLNLNNIIRTAEYGGFSDFSTDPVAHEINNIKHRVETNLKCTYSELKYEASPCDFSNSDNITLDILRAIRFWGFNLKLYNGVALMPYYPDIKSKITYRQDRIWKICDPEKGFSCEFRIDTSKNKISCYVLFLKRIKEQQGNFYEFKHFVINQIKLIFLDFLQYEYLIGRAIYSTNSEIRNETKGDWRLLSKIWIGNDGVVYEVSGLKYLYLKMGFVLGELIDPSLDAQRDYVILLKDNI
jgi:hypothetical protein